MSETKGENQLYISYYFIVLFVKGDALYEILKVFFLSQLAEFLSLQHVAFYFFYLIHVTISTNVTNYINWLSNIKPTLQSWDKSHLVLVCYFFNILPNLVDNTLF